MVHVIIHLKLRVQGEKTRRKNKKVAGFFKVLDSVLDSILNSV